MVLLYKEGSEEIRMVKSFFVGRSSTGKGFVKKGLLIFAVAVAATGMLTACGSKNPSNESTQESTQAKEVALSDVHEAVKAVYGDMYVPEMQQDAEYISNIYGISEDMYEEAIAEISMMSVHVDTFVAIKAKEGQADAVEQKLTEYREYLLNDTLQYPMNIPKIQASQVVREGDYVFFVQLGHVENDMLDEDELLKKYQESNQLAVDAIQEQFK